MRTSALARVAEYPGRAFASSLLYAVTCLHQTPRRSGSGRDRCRATSLHARDPALTHAHALQKSSSNDSNIHILPKLVFIIFAPQVSFTGPPVTSAGLPAIYYSSPYSIECIDYLEEAGGFISALGGRTVCASGRQGQL